MSAMSPMHDDYCGALEYPAKACDCGLDKLRAARAELPVATARSEAAEKERDSALAELRGCRENLETTLESEARNIARAEAAEREVKLWELAATIAKADRADLIARAEAAEADLDRDDREAWRQCDTLRIRAEAAEEKAAHLVGALACTLGHSHEDWPCGMCADTHAVIAAYEERKT